MVVVLVVVMVAAAVPAAAAPVFVVHDDRLHCCHFMVKYSITESMTFPGFPYNYELGVSRNGAPGQNLRRLVVVST